jgi:putative ABC transport system permease protein
VLNTPSGVVPLTVAAIYYDYTSDAGTMILRTRKFESVFRDTSLINMALYLRSKSDLVPVRNAIERRFASRYSLLVYTNATLRDEVLRIFDQTFAITYALQFVAILIAAIGVANTLAAMVVERGRDIGILRAIGASRAQVRRMTMVQAMLIATASVAVGTIAGIALSAILIFVINRASFGWTIQMQISPMVLISSAFLVLITALLSAIAPANAAARREIADVVRAE